MTIGSVHKLIAEVDQKVDLSSRYYGRLLNWFGEPGAAWHYGIGLSDEHIFNTAPAQWDIFPKSCVDARFVVNIPEYDASIVIERLKHAVVCFEDWSYMLPFWNCEHFARLVATNDPMCYQVSEFPVLGFALGWTINQGRNPYALNDFNRYLENRSPELIL